ncbi:MAG: thioether cross-link-forming SCIFF peptide maturase [Clostridia bacterium]|nr:thioether cross-link-forming SCIFF peptide maturase [Clostridia bacterium]
MTHSFKYDYEGKTYYYVFHPFSSSLYSVDNAAFLVIKNRYETLTEEEKKEYELLSKEDIASVLEEVEELEKENLLKTDVKSPFRKSSIVKALCLHICHDCNLRCEYCFAKEGTYNTARDYMTLDVGKAAVDFLIEKSGNRHSLEIDFFGGEPLLNFDVVKDIVAYARGREKETGKEFSFTMTTNCLLLSDDAIDFLNREMDNVVLSIDGRKDVHNAVRKSRNGKECYDVIMNNAKKFRAVREDKRYYVRGTFTSKNIDFCEDVLTLAEDFDQISVEPVVLPEGHPLAIRKDQLPAILEEYEKLSRAFIKKREEGKPFNFFHFMIDLDSTPCLSKRLSGCGVGCEYLAISPVGDIYPCHQFVGGDKKYFMGNVLEKTFVPEVQEYFRDNTVYSKEGCENCFAKYYCSGGCTASAINFEGDIRKPYQAACDMMRKRLEVSLAIHSICKEKGI